MSDNLEKDIEGSSYVIF